MAIVDIPIKFNYFKTLPLSREVFLYPKTKINEINKLRTETLAVQEFSFGKINGIVITKETLDIHNQKLNLLESELQHMEQDLSFIHEQVEINQSKLDKSKALYEEASKKRSKLSELLKALPDTDIEDALPSM